MGLHTTRALVLRSVPFQDNKLIATLLSPDLGLLSVSVKKRRGKSPFPPFIELFCEAEFLLYEGNSEILYLKEASLLSQHLFLRSSLRYLETAAAMSKAILHSQLPKKPSENLYTMFLSCLRQIPSMRSLQLLQSVFYLKMLKHEGIFDPLSREDTSNDLFSIKEKKTLHSWMHCRHFNKLEEEEEAPILLGRIEKIFYERSERC